MQFWATSFDGRLSQKLNERNSSLSMSCVRAWSILKGTKHVLSESMNVCSVLSKDLSM